MKFLSVSDLVVGKKYLLDTGFWGYNKLLYCGEVKEGRRTKYRFTFGETVESWKYNFNFVACKSNFKIIEEVI